MYRDRLANVALALVLPPGFVEGIVIAEDALSLTGGTEGSRLIVLKHQKAIALYHQEIKAQADLIALLSMRIAAVEGSTSAIRTETANASDAAAASHTAAVAANGRSMST